MCQILEQSDHYSWRYSISKNLRIQKCRLRMQFLQFFVCSFKYFTSAIILRQSDHYLWIYCILKIWGIRVSFGCERSCSRSRRGSNFNSKITEAHQCHIISTRNIYYLAPEIKFISRPHLLYGARNLNYLAPPLIISRPHLLSGARNYIYLAPLLIISRPHLLSRAPTYYLAPHLLSRAPTYYLAPEIKFIWRPHLLCPTYYLAPEIKCIWRPHLLSGAPTYYLAPPLVISRPHLLSRAPTY